MWSIKNTSTFIQFPPFGRGAAAGDVAGRGLFALLTLIPLPPPSRWEGIAQALYYFKKTAAA